MLAAVRTVHGNDSKPVTMHAFTGQ